MLGMMEHSVNLRSGGTPQRKRRQGIAGKERHLARLDAGAGGAAGDLADEEHLVDGVDVAGRVTAALIVAHGRELARPGEKSRLLGNFPHHAFGSRLIDVGPAAGKSPMAVADFTYQEHASVDEGGAAHVDFGSRVAPTLAQDFDDHLELFAGT